jgi:uncharacterized protein (DUF983 family)
MENKYQDKVIRCSDNVHFDVGGMRCGCVVTHSVRPACPRCGEYALTGWIRKSITHCENCGAKVVLHSKYGAVLPLHFEMDED